MMHTNHGVLIPRAYSAPATAQVPQSMYTPETLTPRGWKSLLEIEFPKVENDNQRGQLLERC